MSKKNEPNKSQAIRDYRAQDPDATPKMIAETLTGQGLKMSPQFVSTVLSNAKKKGGTIGKRGPKPKAVKQAAASDKFEAAILFAQTCGGVQEACRIMTILASLYE